MTTLTPQDQQNIIAALQYLAGVCDGAVKQDEQGFNAFDSNFGKSLAMQSLTGSLSDNQIIAGGKLVYKYKGQVSSALGIDLPKIVNGDKPQVARQQQKTSPPRVFVEGNDIYIAFDGIPAPETRQAIKGIQGWRWNSQRIDKAWSVPATKENAQALGKILGKPIEVELPAQVAQPAPQPTTQKQDVIIKRINGKVAVSFPVYATRQPLVDKIRTLSERKWEPKDKVWEVPSRLLPELIAMFPGAQLDQDCQELIEQQKELATISNKASSDFEVEGLNGEMYPFQKVGVQFIELANGRAIVADSMGLGKTIQAIGWLQHNPTKRLVIIVVPASLKNNWKREIEKWMTTKDKVEILQGMKPYPLQDDTTITIINYDILSKWADELLKLNPQALIGDEAHYIKNFQGLKSAQSPKRSKAFMKLAYQIKHVILLTGTPITNRPRELYPLLHAIDKAAWPSFWAYAKRYCGAYNNGWGWDFSGATNLKELHEITRSYIVRRTKDQVLKELQAKRYAKVVIDFEGDAKKEYDRLMAEAEDLAARSSAEQLVFIEKAKQVAVKGKLPGVIEWVENFIEGGEKIVLFATHTSTVEALMEYFKTQAVELTGRTAAKKRQDVVDQFQNNPEVKVFVGNIQAAGVGITLTAASNVAFIEFPWTPGDLDQASDRVHRIGQTESVTVWSFVADDSIDEQITNLLEKKAQVVDAVTDGKDSNGMSILGELVKTITVKEI